ncbi:hypothetical protein N8Z92_04560 [Schleiferiaceae bacterium]|nr:hypothetical protein [Schleiferiaceae bacterium]
MINIVFVQYGNRLEIENLIHLISHPKVSFYVVINDGESPPAGVTDSLSLKKNLGYLPAFQTIVKSMELEGITILANSDIVIPKGFFDRLMGLMWPANVKIIAPSIVTNGGRYQNPNLTQRNPYWKMRCYQLVYSSVLGNVYLFLSDVRNRFPTKRYSSSAGRLIYSAHGAFVIFLSTDKLKSLEIYGGFLQNEEYYIAENYRNEIFYEPALEIMHNAHSTIGLKSYSLRRRFMKHSMNYIVDKFYV